MGGLAKIIANAFEAFGAMGVCMTLGGLVAVVVIHLAMKKDD